MAIPLGRPTPPIRQGPQNFSTTGWRGFQPDFISRMQALMANRPEQAQGHLPPFLRTPVPTAPGMSHVPFAPQPFAQPHPPPAPKPPRLPPSFQVPAPLPFQGGQQFPRFLPQPQADWTTLLARLMALYQQGGMTPFQY